jgi:hypothetical protein
MSEKHSQDYIDSYFKERGWTNNSVYINGDEKLTALCPKKHECQISYNKFQQGRKCPTCSKKKKPTTEQVRIYLKNLNWTLLSEYKDAKTKMKLICPNNHITYKTYDNFKNKNRGCRECWIDSNRGSNHQNWNEDRTRRTRYRYLQFSKYNISILEDDPNYNNILKTPEKYNIDHIQPRIAFIDNNLDNIYDPILIKKICNLRENLRIIPKEINGSKGGKYIQEDFIKWFNLKILKENNFVFD